MAGAIEFINHNIIIPVFNCLRYPDSYKSYSKNLPMTSKLIMFIKNENFVESTEQLRGRPPKIKSRFITDRDASTGVIFISSIDCCGDIKI